MQISARLSSQPGQVRTEVQTDGTAHPVGLEAKATGLGAKTNGGELLMLALATCFCNDLYREAARRQLTLRSVEVEVRSRFGGRGDPGTDISYSATVDAEASPEEIAALIAETDAVAEIHNTLRAGATVTLRQAATPMGR